MLIYAFVCDWQNNDSIVVTSALSCTPGWAMLNPYKTGGGEMEGHKADHVEHPSASDKKVRAGRPANYLCIIYKSCCAICPAVEIWSC